MASTLPDVVVDELIDLGAQEAMYLRGITKIRRRRAELKRDAIEKGLRERPITDHAVVRYLERVRGFDVEGLKAEMRKFVDATVKTEIDEVYQHPSGLRVIVLETGVVVSIVPALETEIPVESGAAAGLNHACPYCPRKFAGRDDLRRHVNGRHSDRVRLETDVEQP